MRGSTTFFTPDAGVSWPFSRMKRPPILSIPGASFSQRRTGPRSHRRAYRHGKLPVTPCQGPTGLPGRCRRHPGGGGQPRGRGLEALGGTGDTLTGLVSLLIDAGMDIPSAAVAAMRQSPGRHPCRPTPASQIGEVIRISLLPSGDPGRLGNALDRDYVRHRHHQRYRETENDI
jgi:hypothetical protein